VYLHRLLREVILERPIDRMLNLLEALDLSQLLDQAHVRLLETLNDAGVREEPILETCIDDRREEHPLVSISKLIHSQILPLTQVGRPRRSSNVDHLLPDRLVGSHHELEVTFTSAKTCTWQLERQVFPVVRQGIEHNKERKVIKLARFGRW